MRLFYVDLARIELASLQCPDNFGGPVDLARIELASLQCECSVLPLDHRPTKIIADPRFILIFGMFYQFFNSTPLFP